MRSDFRVVPYVLCPVWMLTVRDRLDTLQSYGDIVDGKEKKMENIKTIIKIIIIFDRNCRPFV